MLVFWNASDKGLERDEKRRNIEEIPEKYKTPSSVTRLPAIVGTHFQDTEGHSLSVPSQALIDTEDEPGKCTTAQQYWTVLHQEIIHENKLIWRKWLLPPQYQPLC